MSETIGYLDEDRNFRLKTTFNSRNPNDMESMFRLLSDENMNATVEDHGQNYVEVTYQPNDLSQYGF